MTKRILVLGSNSPSGASFCAYAAARGYEVLATSRSPEKHEAFLPYKWNGQKGVIFHQVDLNNDLDKLKTLLAQHKPAYVVNFASQSMVGQSWEHPDHWMQTNVVSLVKLLELLRGVDYLERYLHFSTPEVYGSTPGWIKEHRRYNPSSPYASSRAGGDMNVTLWNTTYGLPVIITRAANVYGEGQQLYRIIPRAYLCCQTGTKLPLQGGGLSERAFIHFDDVSSGTLLLLEKGTSGEDYHLSPRSSISIRNLVQKICDTAKVKFEDVVEMAPDRLGKDQAYLLDSAKIKAEFDWEPKVSLDAGLERCAMWSLRWLDLLKTLSPVYTHKP